MDRGLYEKMILEMLNDKFTYCSLTSDPTEEITILLDHILQEGVSFGILSDRQRENLLVKDPICPIFHTLSKTHKNNFPPPLRPIIAGIGSLTENICSWLDGLLPPLLRDCQAI